MDHRTRAIWDVGPIGWPQELHCGWTGSPGRLILLRLGERVDRLARETLPFPPVDLMHVSDAYATKTRSIRMSEWGAGCGR
jgi:hypothetical protein